MDIGIGFLMEISVEGIGDELQNGFPVIVHGGERWRSGEGRGKGGDSFLESKLSLYQVRPVDFPF